MSSLTKKLLLGAIIIVAIGGFVFWSSSQNASTTPTVTDTTSAPAQTANPDSTGTSSPASGNGDTGNTSSGANTTAGAYKDGTYTGTTANSVYGNVQVSATISGGQITDVTFLQAPSGEAHTNQVTAMAEPALKSEAIASQSASVDVVSGATQTSEAFQQSLQSALAQAQA